MSDPKSSVASRLGALMRDTTPPTSSRGDLEGRARLVEAVGRMNAPRRRPLVMALAFGAAVAALALFFVRHRAPRDVAWHVEDGVVGAAGYVSIAAGAPSARLVFDDGSDVALSPGARGRVAGTTPAGAEVVLEQGRATVHVQHRDVTSWRVNAGPYSVRVTGTRFVVAWAPDAQTLDVWMREGRVVVAGPVLGDALALSTGQHLHAQLEDGSVKIDAAPEPSDTAPAPAPSASTAVVAPPAVPSSDPTPAPSTPAGPSWSKLVAGGDYARVLREADAEGTPHALSSRPLGDLRALGDAARYAGKPDLAKRAYASIRARFAGSGEARTAAFLIGRVEEEQDHAAAAALRWYDTYLAEAPGGAFAGDALGRKMILVSTTQGRDAARPLAERYLARFPNGTYSAAARDLAP